MANNEATEEEERERERAVRLIQSAWSRRGKRSNNKTIPAEVQGRVPSGDRERLGGTTSSTAAGDSATGGHAGKVGNKNSNDDNKLHRISTAESCHRKEEDASDSPESLTAQSRWDDAIRRQKLDIHAKEASSGSKNNAIDRWKRGALYAQQISGPSMKQDDEEKSPHGEATSGSVGEGGLQRSGTGILKDKINEAKAFAYFVDDQGKRKAFNGRKDGQKAVKIKKKLEEQHWLEMIDKKHRYGSNLKYYFEEWQSSDAPGNFFHWLDVGDGKELSLSECPRDKLEKECIVYLSVEQRRRYLVTIDPHSGKFRWAHPADIVVKALEEEHPVIDTVGRQWSDLGEGRGLAPAHLIPQTDKSSVTTEKSESEDHQSDTDSSLTFSLGSESSQSSSDSSLMPAGPRLLQRTSSTSVHLQTDDGSKSKAKQKGDVWIYVSDANYKLYIGIKQKGKFQHSSFLAGGPITSAGTLVIRDGVLIKCNPMSGHYRTKAVYFKRFIEELERQGADLSQVKVGSTEIKLWFTERANALHAVKGKTRRLKKAISKKLHIS